MSQQFEVVSHHNTFQFDAFLDILRQATPALGSPCELTVDLSHPHFFGPAGVVPLVATVCDLSEHGWNVHVALPDDDRAEYWEKAGWTSAIACTSPPTPTSKTTFSPIARYENFQELNQQLLEVIDILAKVSDFEPGVLRAVEWTLNELADNVLVHAGQVPGWMQIIARRNQGLVDLVVADRGQGIRQTLSESYPALNRDIDALRLAVGKGVTRNASIGQGNGLAGSVKIAEEAQGWINLLSGEGLLRYDGRKFIDRRVPYFQGTAVAMTLPVSASIDLTEALWGHRPGGVFEYSHLTEDGILFKVADEATGFGNRGSGEEVSTKLRNIMREHPSERVMLDFSGVDVPSASFLDEFLAKTVRAIGPASFMSRVSLRNMNDFVQQTADAVISQRLSIEPNA